MRNQAVSTLPNNMYPSKSTTDLKSSMASLSKLMGRLQHSDEISDESRKGGGLVSNSETLLSMAAAKPVLARHNMEQASHHFGYKKMMPSNNEAEPQASRLVKLGQLTKPKTTGKAKSSHRGPKRARAKANRGAGFAHSSSLKSRNMIEYTTQSVFGALNQLADENSFDWLGRQDTSSGRAKGNGQGAETQDVTYDSIDNRTTPILLPFQSTEP